MKKAIALLLALTVIGGAVFAQATVNGRVQTVLTLTDGGLGYADQVRFNIGATTEDKNVGIRVRLSTTSSLVNAALVAPVAPATAYTLTGGAVTYSYAYGFAKLFDGMLTVTAGKLYDFSYYLAGNMNSEVMGNTSNDLMWGLGNKGALIQVAPIEGLNIGVKIIPVGALSLDDFGFGVKYTLADMADVVVTGTMNDAFASSKITAGVSVSAVENLTAIVGYKGLTTSGIFGIFGYKAGDLYAEVAGDLTLGTTIGYFAEGSVDYTFAPFVGSVYGTYDGTDYMIGAEVDYSLNKANFNFGFSFDGTDWSVPVRLRYNF